MPQGVTGFETMNVLKGEGFPIPDNCRSARLIMDVDGALFMRFDVYLTKHDVERLGKAMLRLAQDMND